MGGVSGQGGAQTSTGGTGGTGGATGEGGGSGGEAAGSGPGGTAGSAGAGGRAPTERRVFVSSETFEPTFGSLDGADAQCQRLADAAGLGGPWRAWLSDSTASPSTRFLQSIVPYVLVGGAQIAADWADLVDGSIGVPIDHIETGAAVDTTVTDRVWTGTGTAASAGLGNCSDWSTTQSGGGYGLTTATDAGWTLYSGNACSNVNRLYCFEQ